MRDDGQFECAWHPGYFYVFVGCTVALQAVQCSVEQSRRYQIVKAADDEGEALSLRIEFSFVHSGHLAVSFLEFAAR